MPIINLDYNDQIVTESEAKQLAEALQTIVAEVTGIDDVNVYAHSAGIKINVLPIEVFIRMSTRFVTDPDALSRTISTQLKVWKQQNRFVHLINIYVIPMQWAVIADI